MNQSNPSAPAPPFVTALVCLRCGARHAPSTEQNVCDCRPNQGSDLGTLDVEYDYAAIAATTSPAQIAQDLDPSIGRYASLLPIPGRSALPPLAVGNTPLTHARRLGDLSGLQRLFLKDDGRNPSGSLKDRASAIAVARAQMQGSRVVATASTGNAAAALAVLCAAAGQPNVIFVPKSAPQAKLTQLLIHGSLVLAVDGSYDQAFDLCMAACTEFGWYNRNTGYNPYMTEGKKTVAYEIAEQLAAFQGEEQSAKYHAPDALIVSVGDGCIIGGVHKGFKDLLALGWIERMPRLYGVQSTCSNALHAAWLAGAVLPEPVHATTRADSINVDAPRDAVKALAAVRETGGAFVAVADEAILTAIAPLARLGAVFAEPAGAAAYAGLRQAQAEGLISPDEEIVVISTGAGLKDVAAATEIAGAVTVIKPTLDAVHRALSSSPGHHQTTNH